MWAAVGAAHVTGSARRRRERRLRAYLRYARMSVQMALAEASHHTAPRGQRIARAREEERETKYAAAFRATVPPPEPELFDLFEEPGGGRPDLLLEPQGPQAGIQRHTMKHIADVVPMVQILDIPVSLGADQLVEVGRHLDFLIPEQVIEVPKISQERAQRRRMVDVSRPPQTAEQLVEVPTIISYSMLRTLEQTMDIPVPRVRGGGGGGVQGFRPGQGSPAVGVEQIVEFPVPLRRRKRSGDFQGFFPGQGSTAVSGADYVDTPVPHGRGGGARGGLHGLSQAQGSTAVCGAEHVDSPVPHGRVGKRGLRGFPRGQYSTASAGEQTIVPARGGLQEGPQGGGSFGGPQDSPEDWEDGDFDPEMLAEAERVIEARLSERMEQSHPGAWAVATDPQGQTYFWHRRSRRVRWTLPPGASCS